MDLFIESHEAPPTEIVLDMDATDIPLYGHQPERFFHGYYDSYCYLPLYIFAGDQLLCARLRPANHDAAAGSVKEVERIVAQLRQRWPKVRVVLRRLRLLPRRTDGLVQNHVDYVFGLARNKRLTKIIGAQMHQAQFFIRPPAKRLASSLEARLSDQEELSCLRRVVAKAEFLDKGKNPRFVVTSLTSEQWAAGLSTRSPTAPVAKWRIASSRCACLRRPALHRRNEGQPASRLYFSALAYTLIEALRRLALKGTEWAQAQVDTIRLKLFKIGAIVRISIRRITLRLSSTYPWKTSLPAFHALRC